MKCKNTDDRSYTGKENTPLGRGYSAAVEKVDTKMKGRDGKMYVVKKYKNGKRWIRSSSVRKNTSPRLTLSDISHWKKLKYRRDLKENEISRMSRILEICNMNEVKEKDCESDINNLEGLLAWDGEKFEWILGLLRLMNPKDVQLAAFRYNPDDGDPQTIFNNMQVNGELTDEIDKAYEL